LQERDIIQRGEIAKLQLDLQRDMMNLRAAQAAGSTVDINPLPYLQEYRSLYNNLVNERGGMTEQMVITYLRTMNNIAQLLNTAGYTDLPIVTRENYKEYYPTLAQKFQQLLPQMWRR
jgi:hypothetical protein